MSIKKTDEKYEGYDLYVSLGTWKAFKNMIDSLKDTLSEANLEFIKEYRETGIKIYSVAKTKSAIINISINRNIFDEFYCNQEKRIVGIHLEKFFTQIKGLNDNEKLTMYILESNRNTLNVKMGSTGKLTLVNITLMDIETTDDTLSKIDSLEFTAKIKIKTDDFHSTCRDMCNISQTMTIECTDKEVKFCSKKKSDIKRKTTFDKHNNSLSIELDENSVQTDQPFIVSETFSLKLLSTFQKCSSLCNDVYICMRHDYPVLIMYDIENFGSIKLIVSQMEKTIEETSDDN